MVNLLKLVFIIYLGLAISSVSLAKGLGGAIATEMAKPVAKATAKVATAGVKATATQAPKVVKYSTRNLTSAQRNLWNKIPKSGGKYSFIDSSGKLYIGQSNNIHRRIGEHLRSGKLSPNRLNDVNYSLIPQKNAREYAEAISIHINKTVGKDGISNIQTPNYKIKIKNSESSDKSD